MTWTTVLGPEPMLRMIESAFGKQMTRCFSSAWFYISDSLMFTSLLTRIIKESNGWYTSLQARRTDWDWKQYVKHILHGPQLNTACAACSRLSEQLLMCSYFQGHQFVTITGLYSRGSEEGVQPSLQGNNSLEIQQHSFQAFSYRGFLDPVFVQPFKKRCLLQVRW